MSNLKIMFKFFDHVETIINNLSCNDQYKKELLDSFFHRILLVFDGIEGPDIDWNGIALVARTDLPENVDEINDEFLNDAWSNR